MFKSKIEDRICLILREKNSFLTLKEIYAAYANKYDISEFSDYTSVIRRHIYSRCIDRDLMNTSKEPLFFSLSPKKTKGNQYGIIEWYNTQNLEADINTIKVNEVISKLPENPTFDEVEVEEYNDVRKLSILNVYTRKIVNAAQALVNANYLCEYNKNHTSFVRKSNGKNYTEAHHLIPLCFQSDFKYTLDVPANIISLCSNCHNMLHYGSDIKDVLWKLYSERIELLKEYKIDCTFEKLCEYYGVEYDE